jgi:arylsulfatase A-like enzyme
MGRRRFLRALAAALAALGLGRSAPAQERTPRPNFILIYTDDQRWDAMSVVQKEQSDKARFPWFKAPNMDRLAAEGIRFRNAFAVNSLCSPSRSCFLTGQYSHINGVMNNGTPLPATNVTHATLLKQAGYATGYFGKFHHDGQKERPGFDEFASFIGQGKYEDCPFNVNGEIKPSQGWVDDVTTDYAIDFLKRHKDGPFDMVIGFKSPHDNRMPPPRAQDRFDGEKPRPAPNMSAAPPFRKNVKPNIGDTGGGKDNKGRGGGMLNYFRCISGADDCLGKLLDAIDELGLAGNTVVLFTSDNGYYLGEHSLGDKRSAYDESMRIPMIVRYPKLAGKSQVRDEMVLNIDWAPTILDLAGVAVPETMQGKSWKPLMENKLGDWRNSFFYEYFFEKPFNTPTLSAVRTGTAKLIKYPGHDEWTELFDLSADPYEMKNLFGDESAKPLRQIMEAEYEKEAKAVRYSPPQ